MSATGDDAAAAAATVEEGRIDSSAEASARLFVRARGRLRPRAAPVVLVHGFFQPASAILDVPGCSLQQSLADLGHRVYLFDLRGYGRSTRPSFMALPPQHSRPGLACMEDALADLDDVVRHVCAREGVNQVDLVGYSWGTARSASFAVRWPDRVRRLALYAPVWRPCTGAAGQAADRSDSSRMDPALGGYAVMRAGELRRQWDAEIGSRQADEFRDAHQLAAAEAALLASDPALGGEGYRAPLGAMRDALRVAQGEALFDAAAVRAPVLLVRGAQDQLSSQDDSGALYLALGRQARVSACIAPGTHLLHLEHGRVQLLHTLADFLA